MATDDSWEKAKVRFGGHVWVINVEWSNLQRKRWMGCTRFRSRGLAIRLRSLFVCVPYALVDLRLMGTMSEMMKAGSVSEHHLNIHCIQGIVDGKFDGAVIMYDT